MMQFLLQSRSLSPLKRSLCNTPIIFDLNILLLQIVHFLKVLLMILILQILIKIIILNFLARHEIIHRRHRWILIIFSLIQLTCSKRFLTKPPYITVLQLIITVKISIEKFSSLLYPHILIIILNTVNTILIKVIIIL